jgi:hypothetical protein
MNIFRFGKYLTGLHHIDNMIQIQIIYRNELSFGCYLKNTTKATSSAQIRQADTCYYVTCVCVWPHIYFLQYILRSPK